MQNIPAVSTLLCYLALLLIFTISLHLHSIDSLMRGLGLVMLLTRLLRTPEVTGEAEIWAECVAPLVLFLLARKDFLLAGLLLVGIWPSRIGFICVGTGLLVFPAWRLLATGIVLLAPLLTMFFPGKIASALGRFGGWEWGWSQLSWSGRGLGWMSTGKFGQTFLEGRELVHSDLLRLSIELGVGVFVLAGTMAWILSRPGVLASRLALAGLMLESIVSFPLHFPLGSGLAALWAGQLVKGQDRD